MYVHESKKPCYVGSVFEVDELLIFLHNYPYCLLNEKGITLLD